MSSYQNHYSATLNKCFYLLITTYLHYKKQAQYTSTLMRLFDINENKEYGAFFKRSTSLFLHSVPFSKGFVTPKMSGRNW
jgi:hypothetical protein